MSTSAAKETVRMFPVSFSGQVPAGGWSTFETTAIEFCRVVDLKVAKIVEDKDFRIRAIRVAGIDLLVDTVPARELRPDGVVRQGLQLAFVQTPILLPADVLSITIEFFPSEAELYEGRVTDGEFVSGVWLVRDLTPPEMELAQAEIQRQCDNAIVACVAPEDIDSHDWESNVRDDKTERFLASQGRGRNPIPWSRKKVL